MGNYLQICDYPHCNWGYKPDFIVIATLTWQEQVEDFLIEEGVKYEQVYDQ